MLALWEVPIFVWWLLFVFLRSHVVKLLLARSSRPCQGSVRRQPKVRLWTSSLRYIYVPARSWWYRCINGKNGLEQKTLQQTVWCSKSSKLQPINITRRLFVTYLFRAHQWPTSWGRWISGKNFTPGRKHAPVFTKLLRQSANTTGGSILSWAVNRYSLVDQSKAKVLYNQHCWQICIYLPVCL